jgi:hypothetical protein
MSEPPFLLFGVAHYREIASKLRVVARGCNFPNVRKDLIDLAARYDAELTTSIALVGLTAD